MPSQITLQNEVLDYKKSNVKDGKIIITVRNYDELKNINKIEAELEESFFLISDKKYKVKLKGVK